MRERSSFERLAGCVLVVGSMAFPAAAQPRQSNFTISKQNVVQALQAGGVQVRAEQVKFLSPVNAINGDSALEVMSVRKWTGDGLKAELRCHDHSACLPFYVLLTNPGTADAPGRTQQPSSGTASQAAIQLPARQILVHDGDPATLVFENSSLRITLPVICLESGNRGQKIRVVSADHKRYFKAEVIESGLLRATL